MWKIEDGKVPLYLLQDHFLANNIIIIIIPQEWMT